MRFGNRAIHVAFLAALRIVAVPAAERDADRFRVDEVFRPWLPFASRLQTALHNVVTRLSKAHVEEAEAAFTRLGGRCTLGEAVDCFLRRFAQPDNPIALDAARDAFLDAREREGVRPRSLVQLRSTLGQFIGFATLRAEVRPEIDRVRGRIVSMAA